MAATAITYPHIEKPHDGPARLQRVPRVRVSTLVANYLAHGSSPDEIVRHFPHVNLAEAHSAMTYYYDHQQEIHDEINAELAEIEDWETNGHDSPFYLRMRAKGILK